MNEQLRNLYFSLLPKTDYKEAIEQTNLYDLLGVSKDATKEEIDAAYNDLNRRLLIDNIPPNSPARARFEFLLSQIQKAHATLTTEETKKAYDRETNGEKMLLSNFDFISESITSTNPKQTRITDEESLRIIEQIVSKVNNNHNHNISSNTSSSFSTSPLTKSLEGTFTNIGQMPEYYPKYYPFQENKIEEIEILDTEYAQKTDTNTNSPKKASAIIACIMSLVMVFSATSGIKDIKAESPPPLEDMFQEEDMKITWMRTVEPGDNLLKYASETGLSVETIKSYNNLLDDTIYAYEKIALPLSVSTTNIDYFTTNIAHEGKSLSEIAELNNTDITTLINLNKDKIVELSSSSNKYLITSETLQVPNFTEIVTHLGEQNSKVSR